MPLNFLNNLLSVPNPDNVTQRKIEDFRLMKFEEMFQSYCDQQTIYYSIFVFLAAIGIANNIITIIVFTRKDMFSPMHLLFTSMALLDAFSLISAMGHYILGVYVQPLGLWCLSKSAAYFELIVASYVYISCQNICTWLIVTVAIVRLITMTGQQTTRTPLPMSRAKLIVVLVTLSCIVTSIPHYMVFEIRSWREPSQGEMCYMKVKTDFGLNNPVVTRFLFYFNSIAYKIVPPVLLTGVSVLIIVTLLRSQQRLAMNSSSTRRSGRHRRTTIVLLSIAICSIVTELPQGIIILMESVFDSRFLLILRIVNSSINFYFYLALIKRFRETFRDLFVKCQGPPAPRRRHSSSDATYLRDNHLVTQNNHVAQTL